MNTHVCFDRPVKRAVYGFLGLTAIAMALAIAAKTGIIDPPFEKRALGVLIGVMVIVMGNLLPKLRPLNAHGGDPTSTTAAERLAGWLLVISGIAYTALFVFAPLDRARPISSLIGIGAIVIIAASWIRLAILALARRDARTPRNAPDRRVVEQRKVVGWLMFSFFYLVATACFTFLFQDRIWFHEFASWMLIAAGFLYSLLHVFLGNGSRRRREP
jgi:hypothetical protein